MSAAYTRPVVRVMSLADFARVARARRQSNVVPIDKKETVRRAVRQWQRDCPVRA